MSGLPAAPRESAIPGTTFEEHLAAVLEAMPVPMLFVDRERRLRLWNRGLAGLIGETGRLRQGVAIDELIEPRYREGAIAAMNAASSGRTGPACRLLLPLVSSDEMLATWLELVNGERFAGWMMRLWTHPPQGAAARPLQDMLYHEQIQKEKLTALLTVSRAVVESLDLGTTLTTITQQVRAVIQVDECTVFLIGDDGRTLKPAACDVKDYRDEVMNMRLQVGEGITGAVALSGKGEIVNVAEADPRAFQVPGTPEEDSSSLLCVPLLGRERVLGVLTMARIGGRFFVQEDLELATLFAAQCSSAITNARMYEQIKAGYQELREAQTQLVQSAKLSALGEMAGGVAHDFNNILTAILGRTQLLLRGVSAPDVRRQLQVIEQAALDGAHTVRRVQEFTRVRHDERFETLDLNQVLQGVVELTRSAWQTGAKKRGVTIEVHLDLGASGTVAGNASELREVFANTILNAVDAMPWGGQLFVSSEDRDGQVVVRVRDTGIGMDEETRSRVFDPFFTTKSVKGTGLGLSVAYGIVTRHRGGISVESERGVGTEFVIQLPSGRVEQAPGGSASPPTAPASLDLLVIDDEPTVLNVLSDMLRARGHRVRVALGGEAGLGEFGRSGAEAIFTDLGMPEVNGWDVARRVKSERPDTLVVLVTGWGFQLEEGTTQARGVDLILAKPFSLQDLDQVLAQLGERVGRRRAA